MRRSDVAQRTGEGSLERLDCNGVIVIVGRHHTVIGHRNAYRGMVLIQSPIRVSIRWTALA
jgi:hypothetical protein